jgi:uncharacterized protein
MDRRGVLLWGQGGSMKPAAEELKQLIEHVAKSLVDFPEQVHVRVLEGEQTVVFDLDVAKDDKGKVIGKQGRTARAFRTIINAAATKLRTRAHLDIVE